MTTRNEPILPIGTAMTDDAGTAAAANRAGVRLGVNVPNFGPGTDPSDLRGWAALAEELELEVLTISDHVTITSDVAVRYPEPFFEAFTTLAWLAAATEKVHLATSVLVLPYRHPLLVARMAVNLQDLSGGRFRLGVGVGWARQEFDALGLTYAKRGAATDAALIEIQHASPEIGLGAHPLPLWIGGNGAVARARAKRFGGLWHPLRASRQQLRTAVRDHHVSGFVPRIRLRLSDAPVHDEDRESGVGTVDQILDDLDELSALGASTVILDPYVGDPQELHDPRPAWKAITAVATDWKDRT